ncbi:MAG TPA: flagellar basal body rod C-terminal domain-containing protein [Candidatus Baltobacteraceae bacterium]|jgi:flagellar basal body rod protein FlgC|nr:flagellar basal body rod C-terminal domain-containing protein [Candidatus Baltobacteraceae bacterium]
MSLDLLDAAAAGMDAQRAALDVAARNVAAAEAAGPRGAYARSIPEFRIVQGDDGARIAFAGTHVERGSNVNLITEMIAVMNASRAYESNASLFDVGKTLAEKTIDLGRL